jgi:hypothetical protein
MAVIGGQPWVSWYEVSNNGPLPAVGGKYWNGTAWNGAVVGWSAKAAYQGRSQLVDVTGIPHIAYLENDRTQFPQRTFLYVKTWNGSSWALKGAGALNRNAVSGTTADSVSAVSDGANPWVAWTEYAHQGGSSVGDIDTVPQVYVATWNGSQWAAVGASLNVDPSHWAYDASITWVGGKT